ncbi:hypothetical protein EZJ43_05890 [Pedobacter changchengzhani]|uniref:Uncharacterized protein n=1 Tax=Pedobacter changchengzhani TaxID=2529274 RepID=A0A4V3A0A1_9SPHI|nr:hypothetical protein [Pedobacter changchengzhani]TDG36813.1 hypothetical protein EZJ43_05890 [Pedobacter changchengzhani]
MEITVRKYIPIENLPSGSGIAKVGDSYYVIGDDAPFLYHLNNEFELISKIPLLDSAHFDGERIIKSEKPDFETLELIGENELVIFGSGSKSPQRDIFVRILLGELIIERYNISEFYDNIRNLPIMGDSELNIEATAYQSGLIYLFNRKKNLIIKILYKDLLAFIKGEIPFPKPEIAQFLLPKINGVEAGFSGATTLKTNTKIIFTASVENTHNAYDDGEILGSFIGVIDISNGGLSEVFKYCEIPYTEMNLKVESVTIDEEIANGITKVVLITDDDKGNSTIIEALLTY